MEDTPLTRRGILASISSVFDPLGIASPFLLKGRLVLLQIVAERKGWDEVRFEKEIKLLKTNKAIPFQGFYFVFANAANSG